MARSLIAAAALAVICGCTLEQTPDPLASKPVVVFTFDDGDEAQYRFAFPLMQSLNQQWTATCFLPATYIDGGPSLLTADQLREMEKAGWETGGHGWKHDNLTAVPIDSVEKFVAADFQFLVDSGLSHESFAYAYGNYNDTVQSIVSRYFANIRTTHDYDYLSGINRKALGYYAVQSGSVADDLIGRVAQATAEGSPLVVFCFHVILSDTAAPPAQSYWCTEEAFSGFVRYLAAGEFSVLSVRDAMAFLQVN